MNELANIGPGRDFTHRLRIRGVVLYDQPHRVFFFPPPGASVRVSTRQDGELEPGDLVEATGFCDSSRRAFRDGRCAVSQACLVLRRLPRIWAACNGLAPPSTGRWWKSAARSFFSYEKKRNAGVLTLEEQGIVYQAYLPLLSSGPRLAGIPGGSMARLRGVAQVNTDERTQNQTFTMLLRSPADVTELNKGSWFNLQRLIAVAAWLALLVVAAAVWLFLFAAQSAPADRRHRGQLPQGGGA